MTNNKTVSEKQKEITKAKMIFLKVFPLHEIDNNEVRMVCKTYKFCERNGTQKNTIKNIMKILDSYDDYFYNWYQNNKLCNVFYCRK
jgi:hypothetical protein